MLNNVLRSDGGHRTEIGEGKGDNFAIHKVIIHKGRHL